MSPASTPKVTIAGGSSFMRELHGRQNIPGGWFASVERNHNKWFGVTYELTSSGTLTRQLAYLPGHNMKWGTGGLLVGPTFFNRNHPRVVPFSRFLVGLADAGNSDDGYSAAVAIQPGLGVDLNVSPHIGVRVGADYRSLKGIGTASGANGSQLWLRSGLVISFGAR